MYKSSTVDALTLGAIVLRVRAWAMGFGWFG
jgi:hypothetical protein